MANEVLKPQTLLNHIRKDCGLKNDIRDSVKVAMQNAVQRCFFTLELNSNLRELTEDEREEFFEGFISFVRQFMTHEIKVNSYYVQVARREEERNLSRITARKECRSLKNEFNSNNC